MGYRTLKRCLNGILANKMRNVREPLGLVNREVSDVLNLCFPSYGYCKQSLCQLVGRIADQQEQLIIDAVFGAIFYRLLFRTSPLTEEFSDKLVRQVFRGARARAGEATTPSKPRRCKPAWPSE